MKTRTWIIVGATSLIAEQFAHIAAQKGFNLRLVGRNKEQLFIIAQDILLRFGISCSIHLDDFQDNTQLPLIFSDCQEEIDLFIAHSAFADNIELTATSIEQLIQINVLVSSLLIHYYLNLTQQSHNLLYLSSVASCRGRAKNSLYAGTKGAIELYLEGIQQTAPRSQNICVAKLGFIDTKQTYGMSGIFYAASPKNCAQACWRALQKHKKYIYFPKFWQGIMIAIRYAPFFLFKKIK